jgi:hypothetical protein
MPFYNTFIEVKPILASSRAISGSNSRTDLSNFFYVAAFNIRTGLIQSHQIHYQQSYFNIISAVITFSLSFTPLKHTVLFCHICCAIYFIYQNRCRNLLCSLKGLLPMHPLPVQRRSKSFIVMCLFSFSEPRLLKFQYQPSV